VEGRPDQVYLLRAQFRLHAIAAARGNGRPAARRSGSIDNSSTPNIGALFPTSAACGRNQVEGFAWPRAVSVQLSALSLAFSVQLLNQHREHAFDFDGLLGQVFVVIGRDEFQISSQ